MSKYDFSLKMVEVARIKANPNNPRGKFIRDNDDQFQYLKRSIKEFGLIVPIVVQKPRRSGGDYVLLDGERRFNAVRELGIKSVPAHILESYIDVHAGKTLMFHVHTNRVQWDACQQCKALEPLYESLKKRFKDNEAAITKQLIILTGTHQRTLNARLNFLRWPLGIKQYVYDHRPELYYSVVEIEAQIITPARKSFPAYFDKVSVDEVRECLFDKYVKGTVHAAIEARKATPILKTDRSDRKRHSYALQVFRKLVKEVSYTFENAFQDFVTRYPDTEGELVVSFAKISRSLTRSLDILQGLDLTQLRALSQKQHQKLVSILTDLESAIRNVLDTGSET